MFFIKCFYLGDCEYEIHLISCNSIVVGGVCYKLKFTRQVVRAGPGHVSLYRRPRITTRHLSAPLSSSHISTFQAPSSPPWLSTPRATAPSVTDTPELRATPATTSPATAAWGPTRGFPPPSPPCPPTPRTRSPWQGTGCRVCPAAPPSPVPTVLWSPMWGEWGVRWEGKVIIISKPTNTR